MMKKLTLLSLFIFASASMALAQGSNDYHKWDVYGGYSWGRIESNVNDAAFTAGGSTQTFTNLCSAATGQQIGPNSQKFFCTRRSFNGVEGSVTYNVSKYAGIQGDVSGHFKSESFVDVFTPPGASRHSRTKRGCGNFLAAFKSRTTGATRA
jgi:hypothetical protein